MRSPDDPYCEFSLELSHRELESLEWLLKTLRKIGQNPKSCNRIKAAQAEIVVEKMRDKLHDMHTVAHDLEEKVLGQAHELAQHDMLNHLAKKSSTEGLN